MGGETLRTDIDVFLGYLQVPRDQVLGTLDGLTQEETHRALLPSGWTLLGLVQDLAIDVEQLWFTAVIAGKGVDPDQTVNACQVACDASSNSIIDLYRQEARHGDALISATPLPPPGGQRGCSVLICRTCGRSCSTSRSRARATRTISTLPASCSTAGSRWCSQSRIRRGGTTADRTGRGALRSPCHRRAEV